MIEVLYQRGLYLPEIDLWLDPRGPKARAFVSHAHSDHFARHQSVLCSDVTAVLLRHRYRLSEERIEAVAFHVPLIREGFRIRLLPAGHIAGSAMLHITRLADEASLLYTGDFKTRRSRTAGNAVFLNADTLVMETTFALPRYRFPAQPAVEAQILAFIAECFAAGQVPVLLGYSLGKAQEALALLEENSIPALLHPACVEMTRACREAGVAMLSGWALQPGAQYRYGTDAMIPLSDHADHPELMECVSRVEPRRILTVHGHALEFAAELRAKGHDAWCAAGGDQLELRLAPQDR